MLARVARRVASRVIVGKRARARGHSFGRSLAVWLLMAAATRQALWRPLAQSKNRATMRDARREQSEDARARIAKKNFFWSAARSSLFAFFVQLDCCSSTRVRAFLSTLIKMDVKLQTSSNVAQFHSATRVNTS